MAGEVKLRVVEAIQDDVNKGIVRIDSAFMREIDLRPGDIVEIEGQRKTVAIADRALPGDIGLNHIRMDGLCRKNAQTGIGETVKVRKADVKEAKKLVIAPAREGVIVKTSSPYVFKQGLLGRAIVKGDIISLGGTRRRRTTMTGNPFFDEIFSMDMDAAFGGMGFGFGDLKFVVAETNPKQPVIITDATEIVLNPEAMEVKEDSLPGVTYEDIGGLEEEVRKIREMVELPLKHPEIFQRLGVDAPKGVLLHGPPGTGKTLLAKAVASETNSHFIVINGPEIMSKYYGQSEENLRKKFEEAEKNAPSIIFIDEIDAIASKREETRGEVERRVVAQLLALMDGLKARGRVVVIAATNVPNILDPALRRPGRFDRELEIGVPNKDGRLNILKIHTRNAPMEHWDSVTAAIVLKKRIFSYESDTNEIIKDKQKKLQNLRSELKEANAEYESNMVELRDLERQKRNAPSNLISRIIERISLKQDDVARLEKAIKTDEEKIKRVAEDVKSLEKSIIVINKRKTELSSQKNLLERIVIQIESLRHSKDAKESKDPRVGFIDKSLKEKDAEVMGIIQDFIEAGIITNDFFEEVKKESVQALLREIATITHGFVGADLASLTKEAAMIVLRRNQSELKYEKDDTIPEEVLKKLQITKDDFKEALKVVRPSALREVLVEIPNVNWSDVGGLQTVKQELIEAVEWPLKYPDAFKQLGVKPPKGILLYGAPGTGKTLMAKAVAHECEANFISIKGPELLSKWVGESEKAVREVFKKARQTAPTIIFFDEIDSLVPRRGSSNSDNNVTERVVNQLLTEIDGLEDLQDIVIIGATNRPDIVDPALLRPGRFDRIILTPVPDKKARLEILKLHTKGMPIKDVDLDYLAEQMEGFVGADIEALCREAAILALRENIKTKHITADHFEQALMKVAPSVAKDVEQMYIALQDKFKAARAKEMKAEAKPLYFG